MVHCIRSFSAVERVAAKDTTIEGIFLPAGTQVQANMKAVHYDAEHWGPEDPLLFVPERYSMRAAFIGITFTVINIWTRISFFRHF